MYKLTNRCSFTLTCIIANKHAIPPTSCYNTHVPTLNITTKSHTKENVTELTRNIHVDISPMH